MSEALFTELTVFVLALFIGVEVISKVPSTLHTPLMSATNAIHGIVLVGAILVAGTLDAPFPAIIGVILVILASLNVFGGFVVMLLGAGVAVKALAVLPLAMTVGLYALELLVAFLQAYVFAMLTCMYLNDAIHPGGH